MERTQTLDVVLPGCNVVRQAIANDTPMALILVYLHAKLGGGLSNQLRQSKAMAPDYAVRWWKARKMTAPTIDPVKFLKPRIEWRYAKGVPRVNVSAHIFDQDARKMLPLLHRVSKADLVFTSPPYVGVTNYRIDNWIRLWAIGEGPPLPSWETRERYSNSARYRSLLEGVFREAKKRAKHDAVFYVRTDAREQTLNPTIEVLSSLLAAHKGYRRASKPERPTQTALFGDGQAKPGEVDLLFLPTRADPARGFKALS